VAAERRSADMLHTPDEIESEEYTVCGCFVMYVCM